MNYGQNNFNKIWWTNHKKSNRNLFINILTENIKNSLRDYEIKLTKNRVRMFIEIQNEEHFDQVINKFTYKD